MTTERPQPLLLKVPAVAELLNVSERHVRALIQSGALRSVHLGPHTLRVSRRAIEQYIEEQEQQEPLVHPSLQRYY